MRNILALTAVAVMSSACVIIIDDDEDDDYTDSLRMDFAASMEGPVDAAAVAELPTFERIEAAAGTNVRVVAGSSPSIRLDKRAVERSAYAVKGDTLSITCKRPCENGGSRGNIEVTAVSLAGLKASSGASLRIEEDVPVTGTLVLHASSGGHLDARQLEAEGVTAHASSGGHLALYADDHLDATASSGGSIRYKGAPEDISINESSGGRISPR